MIEKILEGMHSKTLCCVTLCEFFHVVFDLGNPIRPGQCLDEADNVDFADDLVLQAPKTI